LYIDLDHQQHQEGKTAEEMEGIELFSFIIPSPTGEATCAERTEKV
jgi:hypothetical protein